MTRSPWEARADAAALDDEHFDPEAPALDPEGDPDAELERAFYRALAATGRPEPLDPGDRARSEATLAAFRSGRARPARPWWPKAIGGALAIAAAVVVTMLALPDRQLVQAGPNATVTSGSLMLDDAVLGPEAGVPEGEWVLARTPSCVRMGGGTSCVGAATRLRAHTDAIEVMQGTLHFTGTGSVLTAHGAIVVHEGSVHLEVSADALELEVESGAVSVDRDHEVSRLIPGQRLSLGAPQQADAPEVTEPDETGPSEDHADDDVDAAPAASPAKSARAVVPSAGELLSTARKHVAQGKHDRALSTYATLLRRHPGSPEAHAANVSIGELQLSRRRPAAALRAFDRYLGRGGGPLSEEAHWGRIRALHQLGRLEERNNAIETLRARHPRSVYLGQASRL